MLPKPVKLYVCICVCARVHMFVCLLACICIRAGVHATPAHFYHVSASLGDGQILAGACSPCLDMRDCAACGPVPLGMPMLRAPFLSGPCPHADVEWVPQLDGIYSALQALGYKPTGGASASRRRGGAAATADAAEAAAAGDDGQQQQQHGPRLYNLQALLRLVTELCRLQQQGQVDMSFNQQMQVRMLPPNVYA